MTQDRGAVLINALVVVLAISAIAVALLTRSEAALQRASDTRNGDQRELYLDAAERLIPGLLEEVADSVTAHSGQTWARADLVFPIDRAQISVQITDLTGRLNVNWLMRDDPYAEAVFSTVFSSFDVPQSLIGAMTKFIRPDNPIAVIDDIRAVEGMTGAHFKVLSQILAALPSETRINLNTADELVKRAILAPLPIEIVTLIMEREAPITGISEFRNLTIELLGTEDVDHLPFDRMSFAGQRFRARLSVDLNGQIQRRIVIFQVLPGDPEPVRRLYRWAVYD